MEAGDCPTLNMNAMENYLLSQSLTAFLSNCSVMAYPVPEGQSGKQTVDVLQKRVEDLGATKTSNFSVDCETYQANQQNGMSSSKRVEVLPLKEKKIIQIFL